MKKNKRVLISREEYHETINDYLTGKSVAAKTPRQYYLHRKYEVLECGTTKRLIGNRNDLTDEPVYFAYIEETFEIIKACHIRTGHGGRDKMIKELSKKYANITHEAIAKMIMACMKLRSRVVF